MWYYANNGEQVGPVDQAAFDSALANGVIREDTLVWRDGMADWQPLKIARPQSPPELPGAAPLHVEGVEEIIPGQPQQFSLVMDADATGTVFTYAEFWIRFAAKVLDFIITSIIAGVCNVLLTSLMLPVSPENPAELVNNGAFQMLGFTLWGIDICIGLAYYVFFMGKFGATPGKLAVGIRVVRSDGSSITHARAAARFLAEYLSLYMLCIGYIMVAFDGQKRGLHDLICDTRVVQANRS